MEQLENIEKSLLEDGAHVEKKSVETKAAAHSQGIYTFFP